LQYFDVVRMVFEDVTTYKLHFGTVFDAHSLSQLIHLMSTVVAVTCVVSVLETEAVLCRFDE
jgi:predicted TIM-barrel fold metal-dependent hydrolase